LLVAITFYPMAGFFFSQDDFGWLALARYAWTSLPATLSTFHGTFTPLTNLAVAAAFRVFGLSGGWLHVLNAALHGVACLAVWRVAHIVTGRRDAALAAAALFATTFAHWEAVMWLAGGTAQILATLFVLMAVVSMSRGIEGQSRVALVSAFVFTLCAMLTKETGVVAPALLVVFVLWGSADRTPKWEQWPLGRIARWLLPWTAAWAAYLAVEAFGFRFQRLIGSGAYKAQFGPHVISNELRYLLLLVLPDAASPYVAPHLEAISPALERALMAFESALVWLLPFVLVWIFVKGGRIARFVVAWVVVSVLPFVFITGPLAARYLYLASAGFSIGAGWLLTSAPRPAPRIAAAIVLGALLLGNIVANRLAEATRLANSAVRRAIVLPAAAAANETAGDVLVVVTGIPAKYADAADGIPVFSRQNVAVATDDHAVAPPGSRVIRFAYRDGALERITVGR
jgi:Dolichyl-phosphate-mannose-protein mannosyltransferase